MELTRRNLFDNVADLYDRIRPTYPEELFGELIKTTGITENSQILEIAAGTGQATSPLAKRGFTITAIELGEHLANVARKNLSDYPKVKVLTGAFEDVDVPKSYFDLIYVATAFHWIKPEVQFAKPHTLLRPNGYLAVIRGDQVSNDDGDVFFHAAQPIYDQYWPNKSNEYHLRKLAEVKPIGFDTALFELVDFKCFPKTTSYTADEYCNLLNTDSEKLALSPEERDNFLKDIKQLIDEQFHGTMNRRLANSLSILKRL